MADLWVQVDAGFPTSKLVDRARGLGLDTDQVIGKFVRLWLAVMVSQTHGSLGERSDAWIEEAVGWRGEVGAFARLVRQYHCDEKGEIRDWFEKYGKLEKVRAEANRLKREQRLREKLGNEEQEHHIERRDGPVRPPARPVDSRPDVQVDPSPISNLQSGSSVVEKKKAVQEPKTDWVKEFVAAHPFGRWGDQVEGFLRASKSPLAAKAEIELHLTGEMSYKKTPALVVGYALNQYMAAHNDDRLNSALFAGFVRRAKGKLAMNQEDRTIETEQAAKVEREREDSDKAAKIRQRVERFEEDHPERYIELELEAKRQIDEEHKGLEVRGKSILIRGRLIELIQGEVNRAS